MAFIDTSSIQPKEIVSGFNARFIHSENITIAYWDIKAGSEIPIHQHVHEMIVNVIEGELELTIDNEIKVLTRGVVGVIPGYVDHKARALTDCRVIDVFYPVREDYKSK